MKAAAFAAIVDDKSSSAATVRLERILDFLGIPWQVFKSASDLFEAGESGPLRGVHYAILAPITFVGDVLSGTAPGVKGRTGASTPHSMFVYVTNETSVCEEKLQTLTGFPNARLLPLERNQTVEVRVSDRYRDLAGPMHGLRVEVKARPCDQALSIERASSISRIIETDTNTSFFEMQTDGVRIFVNCNSEVPNLNEPLSGRFYDVKDQFLSTVPLLIYLKWAFRDNCWQAAEAGACLIIDDPVLRTTYGFCDFRQIDAQMREHGFSTNISVIPWNWRKTSSDTATLIQSSEGRFSISVHGCDHTNGEFATRALPALNRKAGLAKERMNRHRERSGISHDPIMVFPQGAFSPESLSVLQQHQFVAAVNTEVRPTNSDTESLTIEDVWSVALLRYGSFPLFSRRYPAHGLENFAFDLLLGKPCLIVEHHEFFKKDGQEAISFVKALHSLNCNLHWRSLGDVIRESYQWRMSLQGVVNIRMFANELLLRNDGGEERFYAIEKADRSSAGVKEVTADGRHVDWQETNGSIAFDCNLPPGAQLLIQVQYRPSLEPIRFEHSLEDMVKTAFRRSLSEFRDTFLSRHDHLMVLAQKAKGLLSLR